MPAPKSVIELVRRYKDNYSQYRQGNYNETQTRVDFVNPLFEALGWDIDNSSGLPETYRQVIHEDAIKIGGTTKAPDYSFRLGGQRKFFVETKKPTVNINLTREPAYQLRRYAWTANLPVSILTSFEEFAVYDGRIAPDQADSPKKARLDYFTYTDYLERWDEITARFSYDAVLSGAFDQYAEESGDKSRNKLRVDAAFLQVIEGWRAALARNIAQNNIGLGPRMLNSAVQMIIDRIIFLRICEDRGVETEYRLQPLLNGQHVYPRLLELFHHADDRYNSGLFHFKAEKGRGEPDDVTPSLKIADNPLKELLKSLYYPDSPFEFSVFPADVLGHVYEQFLGKVIRVDGKSAVVEDKPEVKKAGGVYYTPTYIVDYIVGQTVGKLVDGKTPKYVSKLRVLDPACGSGSFLIGAYQFLMGWHQKWYIDDGASKWAKGKNATLYQGPGGAWRLTTAEKKRILLSNIYGVDIDAQAVEVTKLSLLLKVLEGESTETVNSNLKLFKERALPDLETNIKCGNSLIGQDFFEGANETLGDEARVKVNAFTWRNEFPDIVKSGGFDAVIGNPPYVSFGLRDVGKLNFEEANYYRSQFVNSAEYKLSTYALFLERAVQLAADEGVVSFILPDSFLLGRYFSKVRNLLLSKCRILELRMYDADFWPKATIGLPTIIVAQMCQDATARLENQTTARLISRAKLSESEKIYSYPQSYFVSVAYSRFRLFFDAPSFALASKIEKIGIPASEFISIHTGVRSKIGQKNIVSAISHGQNWKRGLISGSEIGRYKLNYAGNFINIEQKLLWAGGWNKDIVFSDKILIRQTGDSLISVFDNNQLYHLNNIHAAVSIDKRYHLYYSLALLNSRLLNHFYQLVSLESGRAMAQTDIETLEKLPFRAINFDDSKDKARYDNIVSLVGRLLTLQQELSSKSGHEKIITQRAFEAADHQVDSLVYELYDLTMDEIKVVEGAA